MNELQQPTSRRTLLQRSLLCVAGAFGLKLAPRDAQASDPPPSSAGGSSLTVYARALRVRSAGQQPGKLPVWNGRLNSHGELLDRPDGQKVGEFSATRFGPDAPFQAGSGSAGGNVELQTLQLSDGTLFGIGGANLSADGAKAHAILGGTGRFAGAKGSYVVRRGSTGSSDGAIEFVITLLS